jgi:hypothetical protein
MSMLFPGINAQETGKKFSIFRDSTDKAIDMSYWLVNKKGFLLMPTIITEPAVGYGIAGMENAYSSISEFDKGKSVRTAGTGFRYLLARKLGTKIGVDFAVSQDDYAIYIIFGSSWLR